MESKPPLAPQVQRDAMRESADHGSAGSNIEAMMARISAEVTANAARAMCAICHKPHRDGCKDGVMNGAVCPNKVGLV